jgi:hypothetical protein
MSASTQLWPGENRTAQLEPSPTVRWQGGVRRERAATQESGGGTSVWIVDETLHMLLLLRNALLTVGGFRVQAFIRVEQFLEALDTSPKPDLIVADDGIGAMGACELLQAAHIIHGVPGGILLSENASPAGPLPDAFRVVTKGEDHLCERLLRAVRSYAGQYGIQAMQTRGDTDGRG